jgi:hypothetical protein
MVKKKMVERGSKSMLCPVLRLAYHIFNNDTGLVHTGDPTLILPILLNKVSFM